jgi:cysteine synthase A
MARFIIENEGLFLGSSSALNLCGAVKAAREFGPKKNIVVILCD